MAADLIHVSLLKLSTLLLSLHADPAEALAIMMLVVLASL